MPFRFRPWRPRSIFLRQVLVRPGVRADRVAGRGDLLENFRIVGRVLADREEVALVQWRASAASTAGVLSATGRRRRSARFAGLEEVVLLEMFEPEIPVRRSCRFRPCATTPSAFGLPGQVAGLAAATGVGAGTVGAAGAAAAGAGAGDCGRDNAGTIGVASGTEAGLACKSCATTTVASAVILRSGTDAVDETSCAATTMSLTIARPDCGGCAVAAAI